MLSSIENSHAKRYHDLEKKIQEARDSGDTYDLPELKDKREQAQQNYWKARKYLHYHGLLGSSSPSRDSV